MEIITKQTYPVLLVGSGDLTAGVAMCLLKAGHKLDVCTSNKAAFNRLFKRHVNAQEKHTSRYYNLNNVNVSDTISAASDYKLAIAITSENKTTKQELIGKLEAVLEKDAVIAINTESIPLDELSDKCANGKRLIGLNWTEPAHTTFFLEIIAGEGNEDVADKICTLAKSNWGKDPYIVKNTGIRSRLISAMAREASFLVDNGYASFDDIDRACRNDAGYYLPFSGNCRYMDLMGPIAYGLVMKDLNPDLSKDQELPNFFRKILDNGGLGMENKKGFYTYSDESIANWKRTMEKFSYQVKDIIKKYPFNYNKEEISE